MSLREHPLERWRRQYAEQRRFVAELQALAERLRGDERRCGGAAERADAISHSLAVVTARIADAEAARGAAERQLRREELAWAGRVSAAAAPRRGRRVQQRSVVR